MLSLDDLISRLPPLPPAAELIRSFVPPSRFAIKRFRSYHPDPQHPSQAEALHRLRVLAAELHDSARSGLSARFRALFGGASRKGRGIYLDGGFGVGKTHLLAALWNAAPSPKAYLSFDELMYALGLLGVRRAREALSPLRLVAVDEWELDDPGNLKLGVAFLRGALAAGTHVVVTSNTIPDELGRGRFAQKDFAAEIEELAGSFETLTIRGDDFRHRHFQPDPGADAFVSDEGLARLAREAGERALLVGFEELLGALGKLHPIRYDAVADAVGALLVRGVRPLAQLPDALRWVHFIDKLYDGAVPLTASAEMSLAEMFPRSFFAGPYAKKFGRCLSRIEELLVEWEPAPGSTGGGQVRLARSRK